MYSDEPQAKPTRSFLSEFPKTESFIPAAFFAVCAAIISALCWQNPTIKGALVGNSYQIFDQGEWYRVVSSIFVHSNVKHLLGNMLFLVPFGGLLTNYFSWRMFPLYSLVLGIITQIISLKTYQLQIGLQGASGLLYVMFGLWLALYYKAETHIPAGKRWLRIIGFCLIMTVPSEFSPHVSYRTHLIGLIIGLVSGIIYGFIAHDEFERRNQEYARKVD